MKVTNRKVKQNNFIIESVEAGVALTGAEVKSVRASRVDLGEGFIRIHNGEALLKNVNIFPLNSSSEEKAFNRDRKLLLHRAQINNLIGKASQSGFALVPLSMYIAHNLIKVQVGLVKSKKKFDRRRDIKMRDEARKIEQELKGIR